MKLCFMFPAHELEVLLENIRRMRPCICNCDEQDVYVKVAIGIVPRIEGYYGWVAVTCIVT